MQWGILKGENAILPLERRCAGLAGAGVFLGVTIQQFCLIQNIKKQLIFFNWQQPWPFITKLTIICV